MIMEPQNLSKKIMASFCVKESMSYNLLVVSSDLVEINSYVL